MSADVVVLDYGAGNVRSAVRALEHAGAVVELTADRTRAAQADGLLVPGVGAFSAVMAGLRAVDGVEIIRTRHAQGRPTLGICVGEQVMFSHGTEHGVETAGIGLWPGAVQKLTAPVIPHMGWTRVTPGAGSRMFAGLAEEYFYFVHSYAAHVPPPGTCASMATHGESFVAAVEDGPTWATQFHPEKSADAGARLLRNWLISF
ncbi:imidazole glycerol phosphate synthase subunit HisH [Brevibacterium sp. 50QC2O2]|uniref:imidazole glycerol phosphate synthase subunit HisH n=1 Tax=Brevibacterium TaxID=1696 RepID=UPI00211C74C6|nr:MULTISPECIES: imidazole glycerol phosphate synthase subunit HisH [unclassified Brevibacterium]MCQ9369327.1 imidazole glycerol phosphate synthase subunit HisH [Brevibacterium sp. 91QC2O2]MCQ9385012.1 imidazole glycerol phosphate synthase subunit HisH [Brevibacterium sp. 68QC2CO]MCQ9387940.1 imidazole glycerol phosphate synthase subunit HisH [Brevibacterium sp. 50QC2O2]